MGVLRPPPPPPLRCRVSEGEEDIVVGVRRPPDDKRSGAKEELPVSAASSLVALPSTTDLGLSLLADMVALLLVCGVLIGEDSDF